MVDQHQVKMGELWAIAKKGNCLLWLPMQFEYQGEEGKNYFLIKSDGLHPSEGRRVHVKDRA